MEAWSKTKNNQTRRACIQLLEDAQRTCGPLGGCFDTSWGFGAVENDEPEILEALLNHEIPLGTQNSEERTMREESLSILEAMDMERVAEAARQGSPTNLMKQSTCYRLLIEHKRKNSSLISLSSE